MRCNTFYSGAGHRTEAERTSPLRPCTIGALHTAIDIVIYISLQTGNRYHIGVAFKCCSSREMRTIGQAYILYSQGVFYTRRMELHYGSMIGGFLDYHTLDGDTIR